MFMDIPQLGYMFAVEKNKRYFKFMNRISNQYIKKEGINNEEISNNEEESKQNISISLSSNKNTESLSKNIQNEINHHSQTEAKGKNNFNLENNVNKSIYYSDTEEDEENITKTNIIREEDEEQEEDEVDIDDDNYLNNYDETFLLQNMCFKDINLEFQLHDEHFIYYKNDITKTLDETYGDLSAKITDLENAIYREIAKQILQYQNVLSHFNEFIAYFDSMLNLFLISQKFNLSRPIIILDEENQNKILIEEGRNLIIEYSNLSSYVKNNFSTMGKNISLISGINSSGKSCFLRQVKFLINKRSARLFF